ncbi:MAG: PaaI family thioesterase [Sphingorhabdus sp.]
MTETLHELHLPPYAQSLDMEISGLHDGSPLITMPFAQKVQGRPGFLHGGAISGLLEMAAVAAIAHALRERGDEARFKQVNVTVDFMRGGMMQTSYAVGTITRLGRTMANVESRAWQDDPAKPMAIATLHYLLKRG